MDRVVYERFGSRNGFVRYLMYWFFSLFGGYRKYRHKLPEKHRRIVFICNGNICRSPLAEVYAKSLGREAASCGFGCREGFPADPRARKFASAHGLSLQNHKTVNIANFQFHETDFIVVMEPSHIRLFHQKVRDRRLHQGLALAGNFCKNPNPYIHDPYNCCDEFFQRCEQRVMEAVRGICG